MIRSEIIAAAEALNAWYHAIELIPESGEGPAYVTKSNMQGSFDQWDLVRRVRSGIDYNGKSVLDLGTMNGMWAFDAEKLGASSVLAVDLWQANPTAEARFKLAHTVLGSNVDLLVADVEELSLDLVLDNKFDVVQNLGLMYHLENPMRALRRIAAVTRPWGTMILETAIWSNSGEEPIMRFNSDSGVYYDETTYWAPNWPCLVAMLKMTGWSVREPWFLGSIKTKRVCVICDRKAE